MQWWVNLFAYSNAQIAIQLGSGYVLYSPALAARLDKLDRWASNGVTGAARQAAKIRQKIASSSAKNGVGLATDKQKDGSWTGTLGEIITGDGVLAPEWGLL